MRMMTRRGLICSVSAVAGGVIALSSCADPSTQSAPKITLKNAWMRPPANGRDISAAYLEIHNAGGADTLLSVSSPMAGEVQMHIHEADGDVMRMREEDSVVIPAHNKVIYQPMGRHLMVFGLSDNVQTGDQIPLTLAFARLGTITVNATIGLGPE